MNNIYVRFECGSEGRVSKEYGPFPFVQLTYEDLRVGPEGETLAHYDRSWEVWEMLDDEADPNWYSDVIIYSKEA